MRAVAIGAAVALVGAAMYYAWPQVAGEGASAGTAGDDESNQIYDAVDNMTSKLTGWPAGSAPYQDLIQFGADQYGVPVLVLAWLLWKECRYNPKIISGEIRSRVGALGIAHYLPATAAQELGSAQAALDPAKAVPGAARYLAKLHRSAGSWAEALAAYNWGIGNVQRQGIANAPAETRDYYKTIMANAGLEIDA
jgi:soluble lytic murein transglycosylase-like protein